MDKFENQVVILNCASNELLLVDLPEDDASLQNHPLKEWVKRPTAFPLQELQDLNPEQLVAAQAAIRRIVEGE